MSNKTDKSIDVNDGSQVLGYSFNPVDNSITTNGFLVQKVGREIQRIDTAGGNLGGAAAGDDYSFLENGILLYVFRVLFSDTDKTVLFSAKRVG